MRSLRIPSTQVCMEILNFENAPPAPSGLSLNALKAAQGSLTHPPMRIKSNMNP